MIRLCAYSSERNSLIIASVTAYEFFGHRKCAGVTEVDMPSSYPKNDERFGDF